VLPDGRPAVGPDVAPGVVVVDARPAGPGARELVIRVVLGTGDDARPDGVGEPRRPLARGDRVTQAVGDPRDLDAAVPVHHPVGTLDRVLVVDTRRGTPDVVPADVVDVVGTGERGVLPELQVDVRDAHREVGVVRRGAEVDRE